MRKVKVRVKIKTSPSFVIVFAVKSLNEIVISNPKRKRPKYLRLVFSPLIVIVETNQNLRPLEIS